MTSKISQYSYALFYTTSSTQYYSYRIIYLEIAQFLITHELNINYIHNGSTSLINAVMYNNEPMIKLLLTHKNININL